MDVSSILKGVKISREVDLDGFYKKEGDSFKAISRSEAEKLAQQTFRKKEKEEKAPKIIKVLKKVFVKEKKPVTIIDDFEKERLENEKNAK